MLFSSYLLIALYSILGFLGGLIVSSVMRGDLRGAGQSSRSQHHPYQRLPDQQQETRPQQDQTTPPQASTVQERGHIDLEMNSQSLQSDVVKAERIGRFAFFTWLIMILSFLIYGFFMSSGKE